MKGLVLLAALWPALASAEPEIALRVSSWGSISGGQGQPVDGLLGQVHVSPVVEIGDAVVLQISGGATTKVSSLSDQVWNNVVEPHVTGGVRIPVPLGLLVRQAWMNTFIGGRYERFLYFDGDQMLTRRVAALAELSLGLDWRCAGGPRCTGRGAPLFVRAEGAVQDDDMGRAAQLTASAEQAFEVAALAGGAVAPTLTVQLKQTDQDSEFWNDDVEVFLAARWRGQAVPQPGLYGSLTVEMRGEAHVFNQEGRPPEYRALMVVGFGLFGRLAGVTW